MIYVGIYNYSSVPYSTKYLKTANVQLTKLFVEARNNLILHLFAKAET